MRTYYDVLGLKKDADDETLRAAYRALVRKYHPDLNPGDKTAEAKTMELNEAWETLGDPEKRKKYDMELSGARQRKPFVTGQTPRSGRPMNQEEYNNLSKAFGDMFSPESIKESIEKNKPKQRGQIKDSDFFEHVMGIKFTGKK